MINPNKKRLRRTMMFLNAQKPGLIKDPYIYKPDSIMLDLEDAVAKNQKDAARFSLFHALRTINYRGCERVVRINGLDSPYWKEDIRCAVAGGCDSIRIPKTESAKDVYIVEKEVAQAEKDFGIALSGGDYTKDLQTHITGTGLELMGARQNLVIAARAAGVQCFDTVYTDLDNMEGFRQDVETIHLMGFDGKSIINPRQINIVHDIYTPKQKDIIFAEKVVREIDEKKAQGIGVFTVDGKMIDIAFIGTPTCDEYGNCRGIGGKSDCGVLSYAMADAQYADHVVAITDCMVPFPNFPAHISMTNVDYVVAVDEIGVLAVPLTLMFDTDSFFFGLMPVLIEIAGNFGVLPAHIAIVMVVCRNCATFISPVVPATFLGIGLADVEIKDHIKNCFFWIWGVSIVCLLAGLLLGVIKI